MFKVFNSRVCGFALVPRLPVLLSWRPRLEVPAPHPRAVHRRALRRHRLRHLWRRQARYTRLCPLTSLRKYRRKRKRKKEENKPLLVIGIDWGVVWEKLCVFVWKEAGRKMKGGHFSLGKGMHLFFTPRIFLTQANESKLNILVDVISLLASSPFFLFCPLLSVPCFR